MQAPAPIPLRIAEGRFARLEAIEWWDQARLSQAKVLVIGAGALGNEVIKNLALLGLGHIVVADMDRIEPSNLSRSVLFRQTDEGHSKAECAARAARELFPAIRAKAVHGNVLADLGLGFFRWADVVVGALDNREARVFVNSACARVRRPWFDGGIEVLQGIVRGFAPPKTACYECTMSKVDWEILNQRRSCSLLARRAIAQRGTPTTPTTASVIGALQAQEAVKYLHGRKSLLGEGFIFEGLEHSSYKTTYRLNPECPWHEEPPPIEALEDFDSDVKLERVWHEAARRLNGLDALDFSRPIVEALECVSCNTRQEVLQPAEKIYEDQLLCPHCKKESAPLFLQSLAQGHPLLAKTPREIGLPSWDIVWARRGTDALGVELAGDNPFSK
jgi:molybdopterin/thiamine biosynthesis adenylyltransferase